MSHLSEKEIEFIEKKISESSITTSELKEDLVDHFCCVVEDEMNKGKSFDDAYNEAYYNISPNGFDEIQRETVFLLNEKKIRIMKKSLFIFGFLAITTSMVGLGMSMMHLEGSGFIILIGTVLSVFGFMPLLLMNLYKQEINKLPIDRVKYLIGYLCLATLLVGFLFKIMHWPGANLLLFSSLASLNLGFLPILFFKMYRRSVS